MLGVAAVYSRDRQVAAEIVQETWIAVLHGLEGFEGPSSLRTWVFTILVNCARRRAKLEARSTPLSSLDLGRGEEGELDAFFAANHPRWASCWSTIKTRWETLPEDALTTREAADAMAEKLRSLPPTQAAVITLRDVEGLSSEEVCSTLGLSPGNQRVLLHRARLAIRGALREVKAILMFTCRQIYDLITEYDEGFLTAGERRQFESHVVICPPCRGFLSQMRATRDGLGRTTPPDFPAELADSIVDAFHAWTGPRR